MPVVTAALDLAACPPYDGEGVLRWLGARLVPGVEALEDGVYRRALRLSGGPGGGGLPPRGGGVGVAPGASARGARRPRAARGGGGGAAAAARPARPGARGPRLPRAARRRRRPRRAQPGARGRP